MQFIYIKCQKWPSHMVFLYRLLNVKQIRWMKNFTNNLYETRYTDYYQIPIQMIIVITFLRIIYRQDYA